MFVWCKWFWIWQLWCGKDVMSLEGHTQNAQSQRYRHTLQTRDCNIITLHFHMMEKKKRRKIQEKPFWMDHTSYFQCLRTAALRGHEMSGGNTRPDCNLKRFAVYLSEWQHNKRNIYDVCLFIYLHKCIYCLFLQTKIFYLISLGGSIFSQIDFPLCSYLLTRKMQQSFSAWLHIVGNPKLGLICLLKYWHVTKTESLYR